MPKMPKVPTPKPPIGGSRKPKVPTMALKPKSKPKPIKPTAAQIAAAAIRKAAAAKPKPKRPIGPMVARPMSKVASSQTKGRKAY